MDARNDTNVVNKMSELRKKVVNNDSIVVVTLVIKLLLDVQYFIHVATRKQKRVKIIQMDVKKFVVDVVLIGALVLDASRMITN